MNVKSTRRQLLAGAAMLGAARVASTGQAEAGRRAGRVRVVFLTGASDLPYHHWRESTDFLRGVLERTGRFDVKVIEEVRGITPATLQPFDVAVLNYNGPRWGAPAESAIEAFVRAGKGLVSFHGVTYGEFYGMVPDNGWKASPKGDRGWAAYGDVVGATWDPPKIGHGPRHVFQVKWTDRAHPVSSGLDADFQANDELYHKLNLKPAAHVLATAYDDPATGGTGRDEPIVWASRFGAGRTLHITLGHDLSALWQSGFLTAFARGSEWAATGAVTLPAHVAAVAAPNRAVRVLLVTGGHPFPTAFYSVLDGYTDIVWEHAASQREAYRDGLAERYDVLVLHDLANDLGEAERASLRAYIEAGKGIVSTHHAIVDYTAWPWFHESVIGGKYYEKSLDGHPASAYKEGVEFVARATAAGARHAVLTGVPPIPVHDEVYRNMWFAPGIEVLMETDHPLNDKSVVYTGVHPKARSIYIQMGHSASTHRHPGYRRLVHNSILWCARRQEGFGA